MTVNHDGVFYISGDVLLIENLRGSVTWTGIQPAISPLSLGCFHPFVSLTGKTGLSRKLPGNLWIYLVERAYERREAENERTNDKPNLT